MKAKDLIKILEANPEADILIDAPEKYYPIEAAVYKWGPTFIVTTQAMMDATELEDSEVRAFADLVADGQEYWVEDAHAYFPGPERDEC